jgi:hypothetical protein
VLPVGMVLPGTHPPPTRLSLDARDNEAWEVVIKFTGPVISILRIYTPRR